ncbi:MAG TPA: hypothetical protein VK427_05975 [Kofleriaceae bacterium]|nr:hypothetical protein [Kofleriaceae bacterium]
MRWPDFTKQHPDAWVIVEVVASRGRQLEHVAVVEQCGDAETTYRRYRELRRAAPDRELCFLHTGWVGVELEERFQFSRELRHIVITPLR